VSIRIFFAFSEIRIEVRVLLFFGLVERHTSQLHPTVGTPVDVPEPKMVIFIIFSQKSLGKSFNGESKNDSQQQDNIIINSSILKVKSFIFFLLERKLSVKGF